MREYQADWDIPQCYKCPLTQILMRTPVLTRYGNTYELASVQKYIAESKSDPIAGLPLNESQLVPNLNLKHAIEAFLDENPWAYEYTPGEDIHSIKFDP